MRYGAALLLACGFMLGCGAKPPPPPPPPPPPAAAPAPVVNPCDTQTIDPTQNPCAGRATETSTPSPTPKALD